MLTWFRPRGIQDGERCRTVWITLDDVDEENGALRMMPGLFKQGRRLVSYPSPLYTCGRTHARTHTRAHTHAHTNVRTQMPPAPPPPLPPLPLPPSLRAHTYANNGTKVGQPPPHPPPWPLPRPLPSQHTYHQCAGQCVFDGRSSKQCAWSWLVGRLRRLNLTTTSLPSSFSTTTASTQRTWTRVVRRLYSV